MKYAETVCAPLILTLFWSGTQLLSKDHSVDPTFLHRFVPQIQEKKADVTTATCHYKPIFGEGDSDTRIVKSVVRFGMISIDPGGTSAPVSYPNEEQVYVILEGQGTLLYGEQTVPVRQNDFVYLPPGIRHGITNSSTQACRAVVMGFRLAAGEGASAPEKILMSNVDDVRKQVVEGHPPSTLYQLLMGDVKSTRDRIAAGHVLTSLFMMEFAPGGTNIPHHHEYEEEIYLVLEGTGEMVAGGGTDGTEGKYPAHAGDAYFFRLNCTVDFYKYNSHTSNGTIRADRPLIPARKAAR